MGAVQYSKIPSPRKLKDELPLGQLEAERVAQSRDEIRRILFEDDERFLLVVGPCSVHDVNFCLEYAKRLVVLQKKYSSLFYVVMRCYLEKTRTALGWNGFVSSPSVDGKLDIEEGVRCGRDFLLRVAKLGLPIAYEVVDPLVFPYFDDIISWASIGARSARSQVYRFVSSAHQFPFAFKNTLEGDLEAPCNAILTSRSSHAFLAMDDDGLISSCITSGNPYSHLVLRGFRKGEMPFKNCDIESLCDARELLLEKGLPPSILVDASHDNSGKKPEVQEEVFFQMLQLRYGKEVPSQHDDTVFAQRTCNVAETFKMIRGVMLESFLEEGAISEAEFKKTRRGDVSITDACMGWERTERIVRTAWEKYKDAKSGVTEIEPIERKVNACTRKKIEIYTDGACSGNPGRGGWGFVIVENGRVIVQKSGFDAETTNNRMEMQAVIEALQEVNERDMFRDCQFTLFTDSSYVKNGITQWISKWKQNGWKSSSRAPVKNQDLWLLLDSLTSRFNSSLSWRWVKGHAGNSFNEMCDRLASEQAQSGKMRRAEEQCSLPF